jgi:cation:H+ antiporter
MSHDFPSSSLDACALLVREQTGAYRPAQFDEVLRAAQLLLVRRVRGSDALATETAAELQAHAMPLPRSLMWVGVGLVVLVGSSQMLVWGAVQIAQSLGVSDLIIGLTVVAVGTSLPELASCVAAARKGEHDIALGNVLGSNLFNSLAVVGIAGAIAPMQIDAEVLTRDYPMMLGLTVVLFLMGWGFRKRQGRINRLEALALLAAYAGYTGFLITTMVPAA